MSNNKNTSNRIIIWIGLLFIAGWIVAGIFLLVNYVPSIKKAIILATTVKPETFTELYFENHLSLPKKVTLFKENNFKFIIHNLEDKDIEYALEVFIDTGGEKYVVDKKTILIKKNEYKTITEDFIVTIPSQRAKVVVNLINKNQQIDFWIEVE
ncbi:MAG: hypothetical protein IMZ41_00175 [Actinobacteria bacterium]|nr:hypothetical protein [Actinomycetota bacterium]